LWTQWSNWLNKGMLGNQTLEIDMNKTYHIYWEDIKIGTSRLEKADVRMGVVFGALEVCGSEFGYDFIKDYCQRKQIDLTCDDPELRLISTRTIDALKIVNEDGVEIKGVGNQISGMDGEEFEITIEGVPSPFYEEEFPHHVADPI